MVPRKPNDLDALCMTRAAYALLPGIAMHIGAGGSVVLGTLLVGLMVSYVLDLLKFAEGALVAVWATLAGSYAALLFASDMFTTARLASVSSLLLMCIGQNLFLACTWVSLQVRLPRLAFFTLRDV